MFALVVLGFVMLIVYAPALWNGALQGKPISEVAAHAVGLAPELVAQGDALAPETRRVLAERLTLVVGGLVLFLAVGLMGTFYYGVWILQRERRARLVDRLQALSLRYHDESRVGDALYRTYQDSAMVTQVIQAYLLAPIMQLTQSTLLIAALALFAPPLALALAALWLPLLALGRAFSPRLRAGFRVARETNSALPSRIQEPVGRARDHGLEYLTARSRGLARDGGARGLPAGRRRRSGRRGSRSWPRRWSRRSPRARASRSGSRSWRGIPAGPASSRCSRARACSSGRSACTTPGRACSRPRRARRSG
jgi:ABC-type multidrug transport system fused ATPase/permease subunit